MLFPDDLNKLKERGKKDLVKIDHSDIKYAPFRKEFYIEVIFMPVWFRTGQYPMD